MRTAHPLGRSSSGRGIPYAGLRCFSGASREQTLMPCGGDKARRTGTCPTEAPASVLRVRRRALPPGGECGLVTPLDARWWRPGYPSRPPVACVMPSDGRLDAGDTSHTRRGRPGSAQFVAGEGARSSSHRCRTAGQPTRTAPWCGVDRIRAFWRIPLRRTRDSMWTDDNSASHTTFRIIDRPTPFD